MAAGRLKRFLHLESPRRKPPEAPAPQAEGRFDRMEPPAEPAPAAGGSPAQDRFRLPPERPLELAEAPEGTQPFVRCARCETDNSLYAPTCASCQADLGTEEQRAFNERLWAARREEAARQDAALAEQERRRERLAAEELAARRELAAAMARQEAERVRERLGEATWGGLGRGWGRDGGGWTPLGIRLLRLIPNPWARLAVGGAALAVPLLLLVASPSGSWLRVAGALLLLLVMLLLAPGGVFREPWW
jgi:hypothetical protein